MRCPLMITVATLVIGLAAASSAGPAEGVIGTRPPEWQLGDWINSQPLSLKGLAGKVVLVRWWTAPGCPYCKATAPALNDFWDRYHGRGLVVIGVYHHKAAGPLDPAVVRRSAERFGFRFPVAVDRDWRTLRHWWLNEPGRKWTSVSFLLDRHGVVRHVHPGGQYVKGDDDYRALEAKIKALLAER